MTERIGKSLLAREAILAAMEAKQRTAPGADLPQRAFGEALGVAGTGGTRPAEKTVDPSELLSGGLKDVDRAVKRSEMLEEALVTGKVEDFHEVAVQLKQADLGFRFAVEVRNKLIDAYREIMRMNV